MQVVGITFISLVLKCVCVCAVSLQLDSTREEVSLMEVDLMALRKNVREAGWAISNAAAEVDDLTRAAAAAQAAADAAGTGALQPVENLDTQLADLESEQRRVEGAREDIIRRQGRIKVYYRL